MSQILREPDAEAFCYEEDGHMAHYSGPLGTFTFDKTQFQLRKQPVPASGDLPATETIVLKYVGTETDGRKISIPDGCTDISLTFAGTGITSAPRIPSGVEYAVGAFKGCEGLTDARGSIPCLPPTVKDASYMFAGCSRLGRGPDVPGTAGAMDGMYYGCSSLSRTPSVGRGVGRMDYAFAACPSLREPPRIPGTVTSARYVTACCPGIDAARDRARARYERRLDGKGLGSMVGSAFAACLQYHALRKQGLGVMFAPVAVRMMRKHGQMGTTLASGVADVLRAGRSRTGMVLAFGIQARERTKRREREANRRQKLAEWDAMYGGGTEPSSEILSKYAASGCAEALSGLPGRIHGEAAGPVSRGAKAEGRLGTVAGEGTARTDTGQEHGLTI